MNAVGLQDSSHGGAALAAAVSEAAAEKQQCTGGPFGSNGNVDAT